MDCPSVVAVADTHGRERALGPLPEGDLFIHAGDLLRSGSIDELEVTARWLNELPFRKKVVIAGNSDWCFLTWAFNLPRGTSLAEKWDLVPVETDILITHGPPRGFGDRTPVGRIGCDDLLSMIRRVRPALHVFGHAHGGGGLWRDRGTCLVNVTTCAGVRGPTVLDIDLVNLAVTAISVPSAD